MSRVGWSITSWTCSCDSILSSHFRQLSAARAPGVHISRGGDLLLLPIALSAWWTLAYQFVLLTRLPAWSVIPIFVILSVLGFYGARRWLKEGPIPRVPYRFCGPHLLLLAMGLGCGTIVLFLLRPNQDDVVYFHRALVQVHHLSEPIFTRQTSVDLDASAFSPVHLATSHEMLMALLGHFMGMDPLYFYQVIGHSVCAFAIPFVFYFCARSFDLERWPAAIGAACAVTFLLIDSVGAASFGNTAFCRMWQGKAIVWVFFPAIALSLSYRFLTKKRRSDVYWLTLLAISGVGLSNSALYLVPAAIGCSCLAFCTMQLLERRSVNELWQACKLSLILAIPLVYPVGILFALKLGVIPIPTNIKAFGPSLIPWRQGIDYVVGRPPSQLWRDLTILSAVPLLILGGRKGIFVFLYFCYVAALCLSPVMAHFWMRNLTAACYFRLVYLLPLPLLCSFLPLAVRPSPEADGKWQSRVLPVIGLLVVLIISSYNYRKLSISPRNKRLTWKSPFADQILPANLQFAAAAGPYIARSKLLAPGWTASCELPLLFPRMKVVAPRLVTHYFDNAGNSSEGALRGMAQAFIEDRKINDPNILARLSASFQTVITSGRATAIAVSETQSERVTKALRLFDPRWHRVLQAGGLVLILPDATAIDRRNDRF